MPGPRLVDALKAFQARFPSVALRLNVEALGAVQQHVIGGKALLTGSVEVDYTYLEHWKFLDKWGVAAFFDAGNATSSLSSASLQRGTGVGLRWLSPIGPIHLDAAWAISQPGHPLRIHFTVGPDL